jgi:23S rRNA pseudouridine1911/1915/1917 synthase
MYFVLLLWSSLFAWTATGMARGSSSGGRGGSKSRGGGPPKGPEFVHKTRVTREQPQTLLPFLLDVFAAGKRTTAKQWLTTGVVAVNEMAQSQHNYPLRVDDLVVVRSGPPVQKRVSGFVFPDGMKVLRDDPSFLVVDKPCGYHANEASRLREAAPVKKWRTGSIKKREEIATVQQLLSDFLRKKRDASGSSSSSKSNDMSRDDVMGRNSNTDANINGKLVAIHPLDRDVSGVSLFSKSAFVSRELLARWGGVGKTYECVCAGLIEPPQGSLRSLLDERGNKTLVVQRDASGAYLAGATEAICHYRTLRTMKSRLQHGEGEGKGARYYSLLEVSLETDVRDQIRAQLAGCGSPVVGKGWSVLCVHCFHN